MSQWERWLQHEVARELQGRHFLTLSHFTPEQIHWLLDFAAELKQAGIAAARDILAGQTVALLFEKPSTRTRLSFETAVWQLGAHPLSLNVNDLQMRRGETLEDTARVMGRYVQGVTMRTFGQDRLETFAEAAGVPVINALTDMYHPCQVMADLLTLKEHFSRLKGLHLVYLGDGNNMTHSLMIGGAKVGMKVTACTPPGHEPKEEVVRLAQEIAAETGGAIQLTTDPQAAVADADALYTDAWVSMGQEDGGEALRRRMEPYRIDARLLAVAPDHAVVLHCLPAHRGEEITSEVLDGPASLVWDEAENRLHVQKAILAALLSGRQ